MSLYARYTEYAYDPERTQEVFDFWRDPSTTRPQGQPGFHAGYVFDSEDSPGLIRIVTMWKDRESFEAYFATPGHMGIGDQLAELGVTNTARDGLHSELEMEQSVGHVRIIRTELLDPAFAPEVIAFWQQRGRAVLERAAHRARAYLDEAKGMFVVQLWWGSAEQADAFVASEAHRVEFEEPMDRWVRRLDRVEGTPLD